MVEKARRSLRELSEEVATNPGSAAFVDLVAAYRERGDLDRALRLCLRGLTRHPTHVEAHYELGRIYQERGERELALDEWGIVRRLAPEHMQARCATAELYLKEGKIEAAERELLNARELASGEPWVEGLWSRLQEAILRANGTRQGGLFTEVVAQYGGAVNAVLLDGDGQVVEEPGVTPPEGLIELARELSGARAEAERVSRYLELGCWSGMVVESGSARIAAAPVGEGAVVVWSDGNLPAGRAARALERVKALARRHLGVEDDA